MDLSAIAMAGPAQAILLPLFFYKDNNERLHQTRMRNSTAEVIKTP